MSKSKVRSLSITSQESYSAVMIADLVAEVPVNPEPEHETKKSTKEETNLAYDGHLDVEARSPVVDGTETAITNGGGISRGVILNAVQFGQADSKTKCDEKPIQLTATLPVPPLTQQISEPKGFKDMSFPRKIAFGVSFLPSVLFVLCFSIILPCNLPKPCVEEMWIQTFNDTEATSRLEIPENVMFTALKNGESILMELRKENGQEKSKIKLATSSVILKCGKIMTADKVDCIVMDEEGKFYAFNETHSKVLWNSISDDEQPSSPVILSDCNGDKIEEVALAVSNTEIKVMFNGTIVSSLTISLCDSVPTKLMSWATNGSSDLVFVCEKEGKDILVKATQNAWCHPRGKASEGKIEIVYSGDVDSIKKSTIQPIEEGLVLWLGDEISLIHKNGSQIWKISNVSHTEENRFILYGNFNGENKQVALFSSSFSSSLKVTILDPSNGRVTKSYNHSDSEATEVILIEGKKKDFFLILQKVKRPTGIMTTALTQINDFSTTIVNLISNEEINDAPHQPTSEELSFLDPEGNLERVKKIRDPQDEVYKTTMRAVLDEKTNVLRIYLLSKSESNSSIKTTEVRRINVANWDKSTMKSKCLAI